MARKHKETVNILSLRQPLGETERLMDWIVDKQDLLNSLDVVPIIQTGGQRSNCLGWTASIDEKGFGKGWNVDGKLACELTLVAEKLDRPLPEVLETIVHEMVHVICAAQGIKDCSAGGRHNKEFMAMARNMGLHVETVTDDKGNEKPLNKSRGFTDTSLTPELEAQIFEEFKPDASAFNMFRVVNRPESKTITGVWSCSTCDQKGPRTGPNADFRALCANEDCNLTPFTWKEL